MPSIAKAVFLTVLASALLAAPAPARALCELKDQACLDAQNLPAAH